MTDDQLLGLSVSPAQETLLRSIYGLSLSPEQLELFRLCTGREKPSGAAFGEVTVCAGARSGKDSRIAAPIVAYEALFGNHERELARGERGVITLVAQDLKATRVAFGYVQEYLTGSKLLAQQVDEVLTSELRLANGLSIECFPCTVKSLRSWSIPVACMDELSFFRLEGQADSDAEIQASIRRGMLTFAAPRLLKISTPYLRSGVLFDDVKRAWGQEDPDLLVWRSSSALMNPRLRAERLAQVRRLDPGRYAREYEAEFTDDLDAFLPPAWIDGAVARARHELPYRAGVRYFAGCDPSGGGGADTFGVSICHLDGPEDAPRVVQDVLRGWRRKGEERLDLRGIVQQIGGLLQQYRVRNLTGDRYADQWVPTAFREVGIHYSLAKRVDKKTWREVEVDKTELYLALEPLFAQGRIELLDSAECPSELKGLERRYLPEGKVKVDHPRHRHDDHANALALAAWGALKGRRGLGGSPFLGMRGKIRVSPSDAELEAAEAAAGIAELLDPLRRRS